MAASRYWVLDGDSFPSPVSLSSTKQQAACKLCDGCESEQQSELASPFPQRILKQAHPPLSRVVSEGIGRQCMILLSHLFTSFLVFDTATLNHRRFPIQDLFGKLLETWSSPHNS